MIGRPKEVDRDLNTVPTGSCRLRMRLWSVFDHLFGWSNYGGNKSPTTDVERRNMDLGYRAILFALEKLTKEKEFFFFFPGSSNCVLFKGAHLTSGKLATSPVRH
ncbi:hypothetical protein AVEN_76684-1 [Araneus ventricosus]|uniref:Uncharacterized protein n=1 Tax=Araneus ventricosus TaxID=182803 RepID=A0A4Y2BQH5_ARAVE|nr:hypothetical protein AVEN_76684-1 [Araneus ventricosus]